jgi:dienelactone hydrolase
MDALAREPASKRFVIFGLCSGADNALAVAKADPRVAAVILLDAFSYATKRAYLREFVQRCTRFGLFRASADAVAVVARLGARLLRRDDSSPPAGRVSPPRTDARKLLGELLDRGTKMLFIYSATLHVRCNHRDQLFEAFPELRGRVDVEYFGDADHLFTELGTQRRLMDAVTSWLSRMYP